MRWKPIPLLLGATNDHAIFRVLFFDLLIFGVYRYVV